jgi:hypothetical protein
MVQLKLTLTRRLTPETRQFYFQPVQLDNIAFKCLGIPFPFRQSDKEARRRGLRSRARTPGLSCSDESGEKHVGDLSRGERLQIMLTPRELKMVDDWRFSRRMSSRAAAIRQLLKRGLVAEGLASAENGAISKDFGLDIAAE